MKTMTKEFKKMNNAIKVNGKKLKKLRSRVKDLEAEVYVRGGRDDEWDGSGFERAEIAREKSGDKRKEGEGSEEKKEKEAEETEAGDEVEEKEGDEEEKKKKKLK